MRRTKKGRGWHGDLTGHQKAGRKGGLATAATYGNNFYRKIGRKGGRVSGGNFAQNPTKAQIVGKKGGQSHRRSFPKVQLI